MSEGDVRDKEKGMSGGKGAGWEESIYSTAF